MVNGPGPSWYSSSWLQRAPVMVDAVTGTSTGTVDVTYVVPAVWAAFWDNLVDTTTGLDLIVTGPDGRTLLSWDLSGFSYSSRTCTVRIDGLVLADTGKAEIVWMYWNKAAPSDLTSVVTISSAITGYVALGQPVPQYTVRAAPIQPGRTKPTQSVSKSPSETIHIWWDVTDALVVRSPRDLYASHTGLEGIAYATPSMAAGATASATATKTRYIQDNGRLYVRTQITGGSDGNTETAYLTLVTKPGHPTGDSRILVFACSVVMEDGA